MNKHSIREQARYHRNHMNVDSGDFERIIDVFFKNFTTKQNDIFAGYWSTGREFDVSFLMDEIVGRGYQCSLPCVEKSSKILKFKPWQPDDKLKKGEFNIFEPQGDIFIEPNIFLCPLLAFDRNGYRIGQGGGYYDATIAYYRTQSDNVTTIGVGYGEQAVLFNLPVEEHDQKMDIILTPQKAIDFRK